MGILDKIESLLEESFQKIPKTSYVLVSGGVDSSILALIAKRKFEKIVPITVLGELKNQEKENLPADFSSAKNLAEYLELPIIIVKFTEENLEKDVNEIVSILEKEELPGGVNYNDISISLPLYKMCQYFKKNNIKDCISGGGPDEILAGYKRHETSFVSGNLEELKLLIDEDIEKNIPRNVKRDNAICNKFGVTMHLPYLYPKLKDVLINLPLEEKISLENGMVIRKKILRNLARKIGLPIEHSDRPKKAIQYGSGASRLLKKINWKKIINHK
ncbi:MAG: asparagine synthase C-terminal domain-containing protein [Candidatus Ranarchaeia archaeon]